MKYLFLICVATFFACANTSATAAETTESSEVVEATTTNETSRAKEQTEESNKASSVLTNDQERVELKSERKKPEKKKQSAAMETKEVETSSTEKLPALEKIETSTVLQTDKPSTEPVVAPSQATINVETQPVDLPAKPNHEAWDALIKTYISSSGVVNYSGLKGKESTLDAYLKDLADNPPAADWGRNETMAYWINAYNAFTVKLILKNWPVKSIMDLHGGKAWDVKWIDLGAKSYSLNNIEHDILRKRYPDPRIHFAVNCAASSCPPIHNRAFTASNLKGTLERLAKNFINNGKYNTITYDKVKVSKIFEWYASDFGDLKVYLNKYANTSIAESTTIGYKAYDWALNGK